MSTKSLFQKALALCVVGTFGILGASCGSDGSECPSGQVNTEDGCVPVENDAGQDMGTDMGQTACDQAQSCIEDSCGTLDDSGERATCIEENCQSAVDSCSETSGLSCSEINSCLGECDQGDQQCQEQCQSNAGVIGAERLEAVTACQMENNCQDFQCVLENCTDEMTACGLIGDLSCSEIFTCQALGVGECNGAGTKEAQLTQSEVLSCANTNECGSVPCIIQNCTESANACGIAGDSTCKEVSACQQTAGSTEELVSCFYELSPQQEGAGDFDTLQSCIADNCSETRIGSVERINCTANNCPDARNACGLSGTEQTCSDMWDCANGQISECSSAENSTRYLFSNYVFEGSAEDQVDFLEFVACVNTECPNRESSCIESSCGEEATACGVGSSN